VTKAVESPKKKNLAMRFEGLVSFVSMAETAKQTHRSTWKQSEKKSRARKDQRSVQVRNVSSENAVYP